LSLNKILKGQAETRREVLQRYRLMKHHHENGAATTNELQHNIARFDHAPGEREGGQVLLENLFRKDSPSCFETALYRGSQGATLGSFLEFSLFQRPRKFESGTNGHSL
jgi:hypothetical protein